jgi:hypothetical protein
MAAKAKKELSAKQPTMTTNTKQASKDPKKFDSLFARLKKILEPYAEYFTIQEDNPQEYTLVGKSKNNTPKRFGGVAIRESHVSFYSCPTLLGDASTELKSKMQGTSCVQLKDEDEASIEELAEITSIRYSNYLINGWI